MALELDQVATASFRTPAEGEAIAQRLKDRLGFGAHNLPARLAIARSLAIAEPPAEDRGEAGRAIRGEALFGAGADLAAWLSLLIEHDQTPLETLAGLHARVRAHWLRGLMLIGQALESAEDDAGAFWAELARSMLAEGPAPGGPEQDPLRPPAGVFAVPIGPVGQDVTTGEPVAWPLNVAGGSPHAAVMGGIGSGKTRTATWMLRDLRARVSAPLIAFDFKGDMTDGDNALDRAFDAQVIGPPDQPIPLDVMALADHAPNAVTQAALRLRDSLATLRGGDFGAQQKDALAEAAERMLRGGSRCGLADLRDSLRDVYAERGRREDGAITTLNDLCRLPLFVPELAPADFFSRSWVIRLSQSLPDLARLVVVTLVTDALDRHLNTLPDAPTDQHGNRALRCVCVIDEAHRVLGARLPGLSNLIRMSRSKGGAIMLISQSPEDFAGVDSDFLAEMGLVVCFATNATARSVSRILGPAANLAALRKGQAWAKLRGEAAARRVQCWTPPGDPPISR